MKMRLYSDIIQSEALGSRRVYRLLLPEPRPSGELPLLILLHGVHGSEIDWTEQGHVMQSMQALLNEKQVGPMAILMPSDGLSAIGTGYLNWDAGRPHHYEDYLLEDLIPHVEQKWNVGGSKETRAISGLSMGGYAAIRLAFAYSERFASASSLSGFFDVQELGELIGWEDFSLIFQKDEKRLVEVSPLTMAIPSPNDLPKLKMDCGVEDRYILMNRQLHERLEGDEIPHSYEEHSGAHTWDYWREHISEHLIFHSQWMKV
ncbi:alpha/beta hydrolase [Paenibacillus roseipurpureus]|uniref:Alpha/beta hydrolase-fold protein n=1 Tax=Paenibacillus roseopurpureus TaxID=2918901 RepID=A0AA96LPW8_9BACL|nr:alpha/beta hydrolase-fold protein [Paenibacillus sp. MBLB1832]WNR42730.1 alpha/beta hydrolase-fold protein [Paenibacillus sp. MBLB1832]